MGLTSSLLIGRSALTASQLALQVTGNNFANAATPGYSRQLVTLSPSGDARYAGFQLGRGVQVTGINRQVDQALMARMWAGLSEESSAGTTSQLLSQVEQTLNELDDHENDLSGEFGRFFKAWSSLANSPNQEGARSIVIQQGKTLSGFIRNLRDDLTAIRTQIDQQLASNVSSADALLGQIADLNVAIVGAEGGSATANGLRDQRDALVGELSALMDISTVEQPNGSLDVLVGSTPVVLAGLSRGVELERTTTAGGVEVSIRIKDDGTQIDVTSGSVGGLMAQRGQTVDATVERLDAIASQLIYQVNRVHSTGYGSTALASVRGTLSMPAADVSRALNDPAHSVTSRLPFAPTNGGFVVTVTNTATGASQKVRVEVDLDGITNAGTPGFGDDTSVASLAADLGAIPSLTATVHADGTLSIDAASGYTVGFSEDSSGALAVLGINTYFTGRDATDIGVRAELESQPGLLATGRIVDGQPSDNGAALAMLGLRDQANEALGGESITQAWTDAAQEVGFRADSARSRAGATSLVRQSLEAQRASVSGVSIDEESINLMSYQRQYQGAARFISVIDELTQTLLSLV